LSTNDTCVGADTDLCIHISEPQWDVKHGNPYK